MTKAEHDIDEFKADFGGGMLNLVEGRMNALIQELGDELVADGSNIESIFATVKSAVKLALIFRVRPGFFHPSVMIDDECVALYVDWVWSKMPAQEIDVMIKDDPQVLTGLVNDWGADVDVSSFMTVSK